MGKYIQWIEHKGQRILFANFVNIHEESEYMSALEEMEAEILKQPPGQFVPALMDFTNTRMTTAVTARSKQMMAAAKEKGIPDSPTAIYGLSGAQKAVALSIQFFRRDLYIASSLEEGKDWLVEQVRKGS